MADLRSRLLLGVPCPWSRACRAASIRIVPPVYALCRIPWPPATDNDLFAVCNRVDINPFGDSDTDAGPIASPAAVFTAATPAVITASLAERRPPLPAAQPWHHAGPPQQPILAGANSWLYVPWLHASTGDLAADTLAAWRAAPQAMPWWDEARITLAAAPPQSPELLIEALRQYPAPHGAAAAAALIAARASLPRHTQVYLGWACRQLADPNGYIPAAPQEVLLQVYGGLALAAALDQHSNRLRAPPLAPVAERR